MSKSVEKNKKLIELRGTRTQQDVAECLGIRQNHYSMIETGQRLPRRELALKIATYFRSTVDEIFFGQ
ncbi:helix-turn-helix transcriptional regulator [Tumebacillus permanentifrigoris]|uniref:Putative transcriptional regulator n=1 Tax=Tumebacillus permanentifrigoris TaxID=378543 RepID=A0A316D2X7_9BACL|nr:helix-turn-helix transcriptional regulator [Tumebacillus permanentifrigoris]PWK05281.1 putative transcriptional regulator [Tumebacillus permanentifrigoris]